MTYLLSTYLHGFPLCSGFLSQSKDIHSFIFLIPFVVTGWGLGWSLSQLSLCRRRGLSWTGLTGHQRHADYCRSSAYFIAHRCEREGLLVCVGPEIHRQPPRGVSLFSPKIYDISPISQATSGDTQMEDSNNYIKLHRKGRQN